MSKADERAALEAMLAASTAKVTKLPDAPKDVALSASFKQLGVDKRSGKIPVKKASPPKPKAPKRNWEAQRRYDERHGTVNGYDPNIEAWNDSHRNEMGE